ncbi:MAG: T9SS type A sorting domain-containing protein [Bacteroidetes bacterium]|nr:T9SS type A sorting domain-containing protein [Bacteroidota bacterium]
MKFYHLNFSSHKIIRIRLIQVPVFSIQYAVSSRQFVSLKVYDVLGNEVTTLVNEEKPAGTYQVRFNGTQLSSGVYIYKLETKDIINVKKMLMIK